MNELKAYIALIAELNPVPCQTVYLKSEADKIIGHHKYKRCLAMAERCAEACNREFGLNPEEMTDKEFYKQQIEFWPRWERRWLELAKKFKEAK